MHNLYFTCATPFLDYTCNSTRTVLSKFALYNEAFSGLHSVNAFVYKAQEFVAVFSVQEEVHRSLYRVLRFGKFFQHTVWIRQLFDVQYDGIGWHDKRGPDGSFCRAHGENLLRRAVGGWDAVGGVAHGGWSQLCRASAFIECSRV